MDKFFDYQRMDEVFSAAAAENRLQLFEYENYALLAASGAESVPYTRFIPRGERITEKALNAFEGNKVVLKIVSPSIVHKSDVGGVKVVEKTPGKVRSACRRMLDQVRKNFANFLLARPEQMPAEFKGMGAEELENAVSAEIKGVLLCQFMPPDSEAFGNELLVSLRLTREFGMVITAGLGGTDTELYAERFRHGQAVVTASCEMVTGPEFFELFKKTIAYQKLAGLTRGGERLVSDDQLQECFTNFIAMGRHYSPLNPEPPYVIDELEVNPFAFTDYQMVPLDGLCRFHLPVKIAQPRSLERITKLLHPKSIGIIGASSSKVNFGRQILRNVIEAGYPPTEIKVVSPSAESIDNAPCVPDLKAMGKVDLFVIAVGADQVPDLIDNIVEGDHAESVILIPGGLGETPGTEERAAEIIEKIAQAHARPQGGPVFLGGNCMGVISHPGRLDTFFVPDISAPKDRSDRKRNVAMISQSGAFALVRTMKMVNGDPLYNITVGNQMDLTIGDFANTLADNDEIGVIGIYAEGFKNLDGLSLCRGIRKAVENGKEVVVYKAGRTPEGKLATSGHTASVAGDYAVCVSCLSQAGALVAEDFSEYDSLINLCSVFHEKKVGGNRVMGISSAGFEAVGLADHLKAEGTNLTLAKLSDQTREAIYELLKQNRLAGIVDVRNPMDLTPAANDKLHADTLETASRDEAVDGMIISYDTMAPATKDFPAPGTIEGYTDAPDSFSNLLVDLMARLEKPLVVFNDVGRVHEPLNAKLEKTGVPVFNTCGQAMVAMGRYMDYRLKVRKFRNK